MSMNCHPAFLTQDACQTLAGTQDEGANKEIKITIAPEQKSSIRDAWQEANDCGRFSPTTKWDDTAAIAEEEEDPAFLDQEQSQLVNNQNNTNKRWRKLTKSNTNKRWRKRIKRTSAPMEDSMSITAPFLDTHTPRAMSKPQHPHPWPAQNKEQIEHKEADISTKLMEQLMNAMQSKSATQEEHALGLFT